MRSREMYLSHAGRKMEDGWSRWECESAACRMKLHLRGSSLIKGNIYGRVTIKHQLEGADWKDYSTRRRGGGAMDLRNTFIIR